MDNLIALAQRHMSGGRPERSERTNSRADQQVDVIDLANAYMEADESSWEDAADALGALARRYMTSTDHIPQRITTESGVRFSSDMDVVDLAAAYMREALPNPTRAGGCGFEVHETQDTADIVELAKGFMTGGFQQEEGFAELKNDLMELEEDDFQRPDHGVFSGWLDGRGTEPTGVHKTPFDSFLEFENRPGGYTPVDCWYCDKVVLKPGQVWGGHAIYEGEILDMPGAVEMVEAAFGLLEQFDDYIWEWLNDDIVDGLDRGHALPGSVLFDRILGIEPLTITAQSLSEQAKASAFSSRLTYNKATLQCYIASWRDQGREPVDHWCVLTRFAATLLHEISHTAQRPLQPWNPGDTYLPFDKHRTAYSLQGYWLHRVQTDLIDFTELSDDCVARRWPCGANTTNEELGCGEDCRGGGDVPCALKITWHNRTTPEGPGGVQCGHL